jgi:hypothetical protein
MCGGGTNGAGVLIWWRWDVKTVVNIVQAERVRSTVENRKNVDA